MHGSPDENAWAGRISQRGSTEPTCIFMYRHNPSHTILLLCTYVRYTGFDDRATFLYARQFAQVALPQLQHEHYRKKANCRNKEAERTQHHTIIQAVTAIKAER